MTFEELWDLMLEYEIASEETLKVVTDLNGNTVEVLNDVLYCLTGYRNFEQWANDNIPWWDREDEESEDKEDAWS